MSMFLRKTLGAHINNPIYISATVAGTCTLRAYLHACTLYSYDNTTTLSMFLYESISRFIDQR